MRKNTGSDLTAALLVMAFMVTGILMVSCASYGIGGGYTRRTQTVETDRGTNVDMADSNYALYVNTSSKYLEYLIGFHKGTVSAEGGGVNETRDASAVSLGSYFKYPFVINQFISPMVLAGFEYQVFIDDSIGKFWRQMDEYDQYFGDLTLIKFGAGIDISFSKSLFLRARMLYAPPLISKRNDLSFSLSLGYRTNSDPAKGSWKTGEMRTIEMVNKDGQEALDKKDYERAITLYTRGIATQPNNYTYYYKRSEAHAGNGDYAAALDDFNHATRINPVLQGSGGYTTWKQLVTNYEKETGQNALMDDQGKVIVQSSTLKIADRNAPTLWQGSGNGVSYPAGQHTFTFWYESGADKSRETAVTFQVEAGHVYVANAVRENMTVRITIVDATERELRGSGETQSIASQSVQIIVASLPSDLALPSWVTKGLTMTQVRNRMSTAPYSTTNTLHIYQKRNEAVMYGFTFSKSGTGLVAYTAAMEGSRTTLNTVLNNLKNVIGRDPVTSEGDGETTYTWLIPLQLRTDILALQVVWNDDNTVLVRYTFDIED
jgi:tetratricopeptide (TPR) repeat protein